MARNVLESAFDFPVGFKCHFSIHDCLSLVFDWLDDSERYHTFCTRRYFKLEDGVGRYCMYLYNAGTYTREYSMFRNLFLFVSASHTKYALALGIITS